MPAGVTQITPSRSAVNIVVEANAGEQNLISNVAITGGTITIPFQPTGGITGYRLHIQVTNQVSVGTITLASSDINGNALPNEVISVPTLPAQRIQAAQIARFDYVTTTVLGTITSVTYSGITNAVVTIGYTQAGKFNLPAVFKPKNKRAIYSPNEATGLIEKDTKMLQLQNAVNIDELSQDLYTDLALWWVLVHLGLPTVVATLPATPTVLLASAALTSTQSVTTQPTLPGMKLIITTSSITTPGTLTINGINQYGQTVSETIAVTSAVSVYYSSNIYRTVSTITNASTVGNMAVSGVLGWQLTFISGGTQQTLCVEHFDGSGSYVYPFSFFTEGDFEADEKGQSKITSKGMSQDKLPIGDRTTNPLTTNRITPLGVSTELPVVGWQTLTWLDPITSTPGTTLVSLYSKIKVSLKTPVEARYNLTNQQNFNRAYSMKREGTVEVDEDLLNLIQFEQFRSNLKQYLVAQVVGPTIGTIGTTPYYRSWTWTLPVKYDGEYDPDSDVSKANVEVQDKLRCEYDTGIAGAWKLVVVTQQPPNYNL